MQRQEYKLQMNKIAPDELLLARTEAAMRKRISAVTRRHRAPLRAILVAALALALLTGIALASGLLESVFQQMIGRYTLEPVSYETVRQVAATDVFSQAVELPGAAEPMQFTIKESYYDGETLMLGFAYTVPHRPASFDFGPDHPYFSRLEPLGSLWYELKDDLTQSEYQRYESELKQHGKVGILLHQTYMSDSVNGEGGVDLNPGGDDHDTLPDGTQWRMLTIEPPLPEAMRNRDEVGIEFKVVQRPVYYYEDQTGEYLYAPFEDRVVVPLTARIAQSGAETRRFAQDFANGTYSVHVEALVAPAYIKATFTLDVPEEWKDVAGNEAFFTAGESPVDFVSNFILVGHGIEVDGEYYESGTDFMKTDLSEMSGTFPPLSEGEDKLIFRPVYVNSGPHPEEDMVIQIIP